MTRRRRIRPTPTERIPKPNLETSNRRTMQGIMIENIVETKKMMNRYINRRIETIIVSKSDCSDIGDDLSRVVGSLLGEVPFYSLSFLNKHPGCQLNARSANACRLNAGNCVDFYIARDGVRGYII